MNIGKKIVALIIIILGTISAMAQEITNYPVACAGSVVRYGTSGLPGSVFEWTVTGGEIIANYNDSIDVLWGNTLGTFAIQVIEQTQNHCMGDPYLATINVRTPFIDIGDEVNICHGDTSGLVVSGDFLAYNWNGEGISGSTYEVSESGTVWVEVMDENECLNRDSVEVKMHFPPNVNLGNDTTLCGDEYLTLDAGTGGIRYEWSTGNTTPVINVDPGEQTYVVQVFNEFGCLTIDSISILKCMDRDLIKAAIPTAFTPYQVDGNNDLFIIRGIEKYPQAEVEVFDRWGRRIFKSEPGYPDPWDGRYNGEELPMDSYYYVIDLKEGIEPIAGSVSIVK